MKILHTGDIHLGARFLSLGDRGAEQRAQLLATFESIIRLAVDENVDLFLIAGDLFDSQRVSRDLLDRVAVRLKELTGRGVPVCVSPGTHDRYGPASPYAVPPLAGADGLTVFKSEGIAGVRFDDLDCTVYGNANMSPFENKYPLEGFEAADESGRRIGLLHACFEVPDLIEDTYVVTAEQVASSGLDYLALGHLHSTSDRSQGDVTAYYCGCPEMIRMREGDFGNVLMIELDGGTRVRAVRVGRRSYEELTVRCEDVSTRSDLEAVLEARADPDRVLKITLEGMRGARHPDVDEIVEEFRDRYFHLDASDRSRPAPGTVDPDSYPEGSAARAFLGVLFEKLEDAEDAEKDEVLEAMQVGLSLLERGGGR